jgi:SAM-dependent methyltransferase
VTIAGESMTARVVEPAIMGAMAVIDRATSPSYPDVPQARQPARACRACGAPLERVVVDLGTSPPCEDYLTPDRLFQPESFYPLDVMACDRCLLVQLPAYLTAEGIFREYAYFSSFSDSWVEHARQFVETAIVRQGLRKTSRVVEVASNDGYLLQHVVAKGIPALGIEPARNIAAVAVERGIPTLVEFFGERIAREVVARDGPADLVVANNVFAHVPDINDFTSGLAILLAPGGLMSIEVAYLVDLIQGTEFDTIYHEHFMYYTVMSAINVLKRHGLRVHDVQHLTSHGGSLRLWVVHDADPRPTTAAVQRMLAREEAAGFGGPAAYDGFAERVAAVKRDLLGFLIDERRRGSTIVGYGAPGKASTLFNHCGIRTDLIDFLVDRNPYKHGRFTPGTHIPIHPPERLDAIRPDVILITPWNLRTEIAALLEPHRRRGARLVVAIPRLEVL